MSTALYRWGRWTSAHPWRVLLASLLVVLGMGGLVGVTGVSFDDEFSIPGTEAQQGLEALEQRFPQAAGASAQVVVVAPEGERLTDGEAREQVDDLVARLADVEHVTAASDPFDGGTTVSDDGRYALVQVQLDPDVAVLDEETKDALAEAAAVPEGSGLRSSLGGAALQEQGVHLSVTEALGVVVALVVLAITFGSALAAGIPLVTALIGVVVGLAGLAASTAVTSVNSSSPTLALMIGLAVGIDYALFVVSRHRTNLAESEVGVAESVARSLATSGSAVVFAGATVVIALLGLSVAQIPFLTVMGAAAAATVAVAVVVALTVLPAVLSLFGERLRPKPSRRPRRRSRGGELWVGLRHAQAVGHHRPRGGGPRAHRDPGQGHGPRPAGQRDLRGGQRRARHLRPGGRGLRRRLQRTPAGHRRHHRHHRPARHDAGHRRRDRGPARRGGRRAVDAERAGRHRPRAGDPHRRRARRRHRRPRRPSCVRSHRSSRTSTASPTCG